MTEKKPALKQGWAAPLVIMAVLLFIALRGAPVFALALILLPPAAATLAYTAGIAGTAAVCFTAAGASVYLFTGSIRYMAAAWCVLCGVIACVPSGNRKLLKPALWACLCLAAWSAAVIVMNRAFEGNVVNGLAQTMIDIIDSSPERDTILMNAYSMGLSRIEASGTWNLLIRMTGIIPAEVRQQMLFSLRVSLEETLPTMLCEGLIYHTVVTTLFCTVLPDWRRRKSGEKGILPPMDQWYIPRGIGVVVSCMCLGWLIAAMSDGGTDMFFGLMCAAVFKAAYVVQGICLLMWFEKKIGIRGAMRNVWAVLLPILAPVIPLIMGIIDQRRDARNLRPKKEAEQL